MGKYDAQQVCIKGHQINASYYSSPEFNKKFCTRCGEKSIHQCPHCKHDIKGKMIFDNIIALMDNSSVPDICDNCGKDFPWREAKKIVKENLVSPKTTDATFMIGTLCDKFHFVAKQMRQRHDERHTLDIKDEYDTQDLLHAMLRIYFDDIRAEEWNPSYAGASTRSDFLLKDDKVIIEVKKTRSSLKLKQLSEQLILDIAHYRNNPDCKTLYCFVYDPEGHISNPHGLQNDLSKKENGFNVVVNIVPKGH